MEAIAIPMPLWWRLLGRNPSTVRSDLRRGREKLKTILQEGYDFEV